MTKKIVVILQSRFSSKRLPGKALKKINKKPIVVICAKRLANKGHKVIVATSKDKSDDKLAKVLINNNIKYFRGSLNNVLSRYVELAKKYNKSDLIVRATADNIFPDGNLVNLLVKYINKKKMDYLGVNHKTHLLPKGVGLEIFTVKKLLDINKLSLSKNHLEHVTLKIYEKNNKYKNFMFPELKQDRDYSKLRVTIDTKKDYYFMKHFFKKIKNIYNIPYNQLLKILKKNFLK